MLRVLRHYPIAVAVSALCGLAVAGCASKLPAVDTKAPTAATVGAAATPAGSADAAASGAGAGLSSIASAGVTSAGASGATATGGAGAAVVSGGGSGAAVASDGAGAGSALPPAPAQTTDERRAALDKRLSDSLGSFDAKLRTEQQKIAKERDARQASVATISNSDNGNSDAGTGTGTGAGGRPSSHGDRRSDRTAGDLKSDKSSGSTNAAGNGAVAKEIPDGNDDDVVARRLRRAAEQETDPELKDKLWKEYVEYKKNTQGT